MAYVNNIAIGFTIDSDATSDDNAAVSLENINNWADHSKESF